MLSPTKIFHSTSLLILGALLTGCASSANNPPGQRIEEILARYSARAKSLDPTDTKFLADAKAEGLQAYIHYAAAKSPELKAAFERWLAAREKIPQVTALPDPKINWGYYLRSVETRAGPFRNSFGISQAIPWPNKLILNGEVATEQAKVLLYRFTDIEQELFYQVKRIYYDLFFLRRSILLTEEILSLVKYYEKVALIRFKTAGAKHPDVIRAQVELGRLEDRIKTLKDRRKPMNAQLNAILNRASNTELPWPSSIPTDFPTIKEAVVLKQLIDSNWALKALDSESSRENKSLERAKQEYLPDFVLGLNYFDTGSALRSGTPDSSEDAMVLNFGVSLPIWIQKYSAGVRESIARRQSVRSIRQATYRKLEASLQSALFELRDGQRKINLYKKTLIPKAEQAQRATLKTFEAGKGDFLSLIDVERTLLEFQLNYEKAKVESAQSVALIERLLGSPLEKK